MNIITLVEADTAKEAVITTGADINTLHSVRRPGQRSKRLHCVTHTPGISSPGPMPGGRLLATGMNWISSRPAWGVTPGKEKGGAGMAAIMAGMHGIMAIIMGIIGIIGMTG